MVWLGCGPGGLQPHHVRNLKDRLTIYPKQTSNHPGARKPDPIYLYVDEVDTRGRFGVPRAFYRKNRSQGREETLAVSYGEAIHVETLWRSGESYAEQEEAIGICLDELRGDSWGGVLLQAPCGWGKTATALEMARRLGRRTLILVHKNFLAKQWEESIRKFMPDARVGRIQQDRCEWDGYDFVIGMLDSLVVHLETLAGVGETRYDTAIRDAFGLLMYDEVHRVGAQTWSAVVPYFSAAYRIGLSATPRRKDGAEGVFLHHISDVTYAATTQSLVPGLRRLLTSTELSPVRAYSPHAGATVTVPASALSGAQVVSQLCDDKERTLQIAEDIVLAVQNGRKVLVISERIQHLKDIELELRRMLPALGIVPSIGAFTGEWFTGEVHTSGKKKGQPKMATRTDSDHEAASRCQVILSTKQMVEEGLDIPSVDVGYLVTPMTDVEQAVGRVRRKCLPDPAKCSRMCAWRAGKCEGKPAPVWVDVVDQKIRRCVDKFDKRMSFYRSAGMLRG